MSSVLLICSNPARLVSSGDDWQLQPLLFFSNSEGKSRSDLEVLQLAGWRDDGGRGGVTYESEPGNGSSFRPCVECGKERERALRVRHAHRKQRNLQWKLVLQVRESTDLLEESCCKSSLLLRQVSWIWTLEESWRKGEREGARGHVKVQYVGFYH